MIQVILILPAPVLAYFLVGSVGTSEGALLVPLVGVQVVLWVGVWWWFAGVLARRLDRLRPAARGRGLALTIVLVAALGFLPVHGAGGHGDSARWFSTWEVYRDAFAGRLLSGS